MYGDSKCSKSVLVMGGSYFIGKLIVEELVQKGYRVYTLNRGTKPETNPAIYRILCDRNDPLKMKIALKGLAFDAVIDVCGLNQRQAEILTDALDCSSVVKFVFISSSAVYAVDHISPPYKETDRLEENRYWTFYGKDKIEAEAYYQKYFQPLSANLVIVRPPYVYGEYNYVQRESFLFDHILNQMPVIIPAANCRLQFIYGRDLASVIARLLEIAALEHSVYNVGNRSSVTAKEWVSFCGAALQKRVEIIEYDHHAQRRCERDFFPFFNYDNVLDVSRIKALVPEETDFLEGLKHSLAWYLANQDSIVFKESIQEHEKEILSELSLSNSL